jgi:Domain of unknown function (DUF4145)
MSHSVQIVSQYVNELYSESDRGCVLVTGAYFDVLLEELITNFCADCGGSLKVLKKLLKGGIAPLGTFAIRIKFARAFGLIKPSMAKALHAIRVVRNEAAHAEVAFDWNDEQTKKLFRLAKFAFDDMVVGDAEDAIDDVGFGGWDICLERKRFMKAAFLIANALLVNNDGYFCPQSQSSASASSEADEKANNLDSGDSSAQSPRNSSEM